MRSANTYLLCCITVSILVCKGLQGFSVNLKPYNFSSDSNIFKKNSAFVNSGDVFGTRVFVENKGQYKEEEKTPNKILYALDNGLEKIYFTKKGLIYKFIYEAPVRERDREAFEEGEVEAIMPPQIHVVEMNWLGADTSAIEVEASLKQSHYITFGTEEYQSAVFKKLMYKNVYPNIDIEFIIPENQPSGIKYSLIVHPGANPDNIKLLYCGDVNKIKHTKNGDIKIKTPNCFITEHMPLSFDEDHQIVSSAFKLSGDTIGFEFPESFPKNKLLIIDPWVTSNISLSANNLAYDIDYDYFGNTFIYGGKSALKVAKYNSAGMLLWTFSGFVANISWSSQPNNYVGNFGVDKLSGKCYIGQGVNPSGSLIVRINANGIYDNFVTVQNSGYQEIWDMGFTCLTGEVFTLGGGHLSNASAATISSLNNTPVLSTFQPSNTVAHQDVGCHAIDDQGAIFVAYSTDGNAFLKNKLSLVNPAFNNAIWTQSSGFSSMVEPGNKLQYVSPENSNGFNCLAVNGAYLYFYDGLNLAGYSKLSGAMIHSIVIPGQVLKQQGGIAVDDCNNIYIGGNHEIKIYHFNGTSFSTLTPIGLTATTTNQFVYDIKLNKITKTLFVCGSGFVGTYPAIHSTFCQAVSGQCLFNQGGTVVNSSGISCSSLGTATIAAIGGMGPYNYLWLPSNQTGSVATGLAPGSYTVQVTDLGSNTSYTNVVALSSSNTFTGTLTTSPFLNCQTAQHGFASINNVIGGSGLHTAVWVSTNTVLTGNTVYGLAAGLYTVTVKDSITGCKFKKYFSFNPAPTLSVTASASKTVLCYGEPIVLTATVSGGVPVYTYSWSNGATGLTTSFTPNQSGTHNSNIVVTDGYGCQVNGNIQFTVNFTYITVHGATVCPGQNCTLYASGASTYTWNTSNTGSSLSVNPFSNQVYTVVGTALSCTNSATVAVVIGVVPTPSILNNSPQCKGNTLVFSALGGTATAWTGPQNFSSSMQTNSLVNCLTSQNGIYQVTVVAANSCTASVSASLTVWPEPTLSVAHATLCETQTLTLNCFANSAQSYLWKGPMNFSSGISSPTLVHPPSAASGMYTVQITSAEGCTNQALAQVTVTALPTNIAFNNGPLCEGSVVYLKSSGMPTGASYFWAGPGNFSASGAQVSLNPVMNSATGIYTLTTQLGPCVSVNTTSLLIFALPTASISYTGEVCENKRLDLYVQTPNTSTPIAYSWQGPQNFIGSGTHVWRDSCLSVHSGVYSVLISDIHGCMALASSTVTIHPNPMLSATGSTVCFNTSAYLDVNGAQSYAWYGLEGAISTQSRVVFSQATNISATSYTVIGTSAKGCTASAVAGIYTLPLPNPSLSIAPSKTICLNSKFQLTGSGALQYQWFGPLGMHEYAQTINFQAYRMDCAGEYTLVANDQFGCKNSILTTLTVLDLPQGLMQADTTEGCSPFCTSFQFKPSSKSTALTSLRWSVNNQTLSSTNFNYCFNMPGEYIFKCYYTDVNLCENSNSLIVHSWPKPVADFSFTPLHPVENFDPVYFQNSSLHATSFSWHLLEADGSFSQNPYNNNQNTHYSYVFENAGSYSMALIVMNEKSCVDTVVKKVMVEPDFAVYIPNTFTPNEDNINEQFIPVIRGLKFFNLMVFNRWGQKLFETSDIKKGWDGTFNGEDCKQDVYAYKLSVSSKSGLAKIYTGNVSLFR